MYIKRRLTNVELFNSHWNRIMLNQTLVTLLLSALNEGPVMPTEFAERYDVSVHRVISALRLSMSKVAIQKGSYFSWKGCKSNPKQYPIFSLKTAKTPKAVESMRYADEECARYSRLVDNRFAY